MNKRIFFKALKITMTMFLEGAISFGLQGAREVSRGNYIGTKENIRQIRNLRRNRLEIIDIDWDLL